MSICTHKHTCIHSYEYHTQYKLKKASIETKTKQESREFFFFFFNLLKVANILNNDLFSPGGENGQRRFSYMVSIRSLHLIPEGLD